MFLGLSLSERTVEEAFITSVFLTLTPSFDLHDLTKFEDRFGVWYNDLQVIHSIV
jgi:hypothetical protein